MPYRIAPSILSADFARLGEEVRAVAKAGVDLIHFDVMDNHYVPNLTVGPLVCAAIRPHVSVPLDVHLMVTPVDRLVADFAKAGGGGEAAHQAAHKAAHYSAPQGDKTQHCEIGEAESPENLQLSSNAAEAKCARQDSNLRPAD